VVCKPGTVIQFALNGRQRKVWESIMSCGSVRNAGAGNVRLNRWERAFNGEWCYQPGPIRWGRGLSRNRMSSKPSRVVGFNARRVRPRYTHQQQFAQAL